MTNPEWKNMTDWSGLPDVYVTKAECQQGMFWRIEACSVPMVIGPEVRLIRADRVSQQLADAQTAQTLMLNRAMERVAAIERLAHSASIASCTCHTKTPDITFHDANCRYVKLQYIIAQCEDFRELAKEYDGRFIDQIEVKVGQ